MEKVQMKIGEYVLGTTLGKGTFGKVKEGVHERTGHRVAVKIMSRARIKSLDVVGKIRKEIQVQRLFRHPHIVRLYQAFATPTDIFMIMEYVGGGELFQLIRKKGKLEEKEARMFFQQLISGIDYCHRHMVVHRDIKPENLLLDTQHNIKIADFGLSTLMSDGGFLDTSCGSPNYASPEILSGKLYAGPEVDIWSCGVILYAMVAGHLPFQHEHTPTLFKLIRSGAYHMPERFSPELRNLMRKILHVEPDKRARVREILDDEWFGTDLPAYLFLNTHARVSKLDVETVMAVAEQVGVTEGEVAEAVQNGNPVDPVVIAYYVIAERKHPAERALGLSVTPRARTWRTWGGPEKWTSRGMSVDPSTSLTVETDEHGASGLRLLGRRIPSPKLSPSSKRKHLSPSSRSSSSDASPKWPPNRRGTRCRGKGVARGQRWCRPNCELCPTWPGVTECVFGSFVPDLATCDTCQHLGKPGCVFSDEPMGTTPVEELGNFVKGLTTNETGPGRHPEYITAPENLSASLEVEQASNLPMRSLSRGFKKAKWHLGIRSASPPAEIMLEIFRVMRKVGLEWQVINTFSCRARNKNPPDPDNCMTMTIELFKLEGSRGGYLLDFMAHPPSNEKEEPDPNKPPPTSEVMQFFELSAGIIEALARG